MLVYLVFFVILRKLYMETWAKSKKNLIPKRKPPCPKRKIGTPNSESGPNINTHALISTHKHLEIKINRCDRWECYRLALLSLV